MILSSERNIYIFSKSTSYKYEIRILFINTSFLSIEILLSFLSKYSGSLSSRWSSVSILRNKYFLEILLSFKKRIIWLPLIMMIKFSNATLPPLPSPSQCHCKLMDTVFKLKLNKVQREIQKTLRMFEIISKEYHKYW